jgi:hypothetical protein
MLAIGRAQIYREHDAVSDAAATVQALQLAASRFQQMIEECRRQASAGEPTTQQPPHQRRGPRKRGTHVQHETASRLDNRLPPSDNHALMAP